MLQMKRKVVKIIFALILVIAIVSGLYAYDLHRLAVQGNEIFAYRCSNVNPKLISYKNSFLRYADLLKNSSSYTEAQATKIISDDFMNGYINGMRVYVPEEDKWLTMDQNYLNQWDFKLLEPSYIKQAAEYEMKMYQGYRDDAKYMLSYWDSKGQDKDANTKQQEARDTIVTYSNLYFDLVKTASEIQDLRKQFGRVSVPSACNDDNMNIPNTTGILNPTPIPAPANGIPTS